MLVLACNAGLAENWSGRAGLAKRRHQALIEKMVATWNERKPRRPICLGWLAMGQHPLELIIQARAGGVDAAQIDIRWLNALAEADVLVDLNTIMDRAMGRRKTSRPVIWRQAR